MIRVAGLHVPMIVVALFWVVAGWSDDASAQDPGSIEAQQTRPEAPEEMARDPQAERAPPVTNPLTPLAPAARGSPRETLESFLSFSNAASNALIAAFYDEETRTGDLLFDTDEVRALKRDAMENLGRAMSTMDLSAIPPANRRTVGINSVLLLQEILDRIPLPDLEAVPDADDLADGAAVNGWTLPGTQIQMVRSETLSGEPRFLFSPETISELPRYYNVVRDLPPISGGDLDFYQHFVSAPGLSMPIQLYRYVLDLPP